jgi:hypothetical protein
VRPFSAAERNLPKSKASFLIKFGGRLVIIILLEHLLLIYNYPMFNIVLSVALIVALAQGRWKIILSLFQDLPRRLLRLIDLAGRDTRSFDWAGHFV